MRTLETIVRRAFFFGSFIVAGLAALEKILNVFRYTIVKGFYTPERLLDIAAIGLLFAIVMQLHQIRLSLSSKSAESSK